MNSSIESQKKSLAMTQMYNAALVALILGLFVGAWEAYTRLSSIRAFVLPPPSTVARTMWHDRALLLTEAKATTQAFVGGFALAAVLGLMIAVVIVALPSIGRGVYPLVVASQTVPLISVAPLLIIWLGFGIWTKVVVSAIISFFPVVVGTVLGFRSVSQSSIDLMRTIPAPRWAIYRRLMLPAALPSIFAGLRTAAVLSVIGAVVGEFATGGRGLAAGIIIARSLLRTDRVMGHIVALGILGILFYGLVALVEHLATPWRSSARKRPWRFVMGERRGS